MIDFTVSEEGTIWVLLDADFSDESTAVAEHPRELVQAVRWSTDRVRAQPIILASADGSLPKVC